MAESSADGGDEEGSRGEAGRGEAEWSAQDDSLAGRLRDAVLPESLGERARAGEGAGEGAGAGAGGADGVGSVLGGRYRLIERVGVGGMGEVYRAEQSEPIRRVVAVKVIKPGVDTREVVARFEAERQVLARMDHPGVARVLDAGATSLGRPYFVMEFVPGRALTRYADDEGLGVREKLELFVQVCEAVGHAHTKAVLHRDLKPGNVLAWTEPDATGPRRRVKVIDFGIAKALTTDAGGAATAYTSSGALVGTYDYMSPEQASGDADVDTRTDVYSLGVLLYELLTGLKPFDAPTDATSGESVRRQIMEREPTRPSARVGTRVSGGADTKLTAKLARTLRDELEWIPLKAMRRERDRRYASVDELARDVRNYLEGRALIAGPESATYRARKFARRHRVPIGFAVTVAALVVAGGVGTGVGLVRESRQRAAAEASAARAEANAEQARRAATEAARQARIAEGTVGLFVGSIEQATRLATGGRSDVTVREVVARLTDEIERPASPLEPEAELAGRGVLASVSSSLQRFDDAVRHATAAVKIARERFGPDSAEHAEALRQSALVYREMGRPPLALAAARAARDAALRRPGPEDALTARCRILYAVQVAETGDLAAAEAEYRAALPVLGRTMTLADGVLNVATFNFTHLLMTQGRHREARGILTGVIAAAEAGGGVMPGVETRYETMAEMAMAELRPAEALPWIVKGRDVRLKFAEPGAYTACWNHRLVAEHAEMTNDLARSEATWREVVAWYEGKPPSVFSAYAAGSLAVTVGLRGRYGEAVPMLTAVLDAARPALGPDSPEVRAGEAELGRMLAASGRAAEGEAVLRRSLAAGTKMDTWPRRTAWGLTVRSLGESLLAQGRSADALAALADADAVLTREAPDPNLGVLKYVRAWRGVALSAEGRHGEALAVLRPLWVELTAAHTAGHPRIRGVGLALAASAEATGATAEAEAVRASLVESR